MTAHTQGRLYTVEKYGIAYLLKHGAKVRSSVVDTSDVVAANILPADACRLAACWNACEGCTTGALERIGDTFIKPMSDLEAERDAARTELAASRALLREVLDDLNQVRHTNCARGMQHPPILEAKAERIHSYLDACDTLGGGEG